MGEAALCVLLASRRELNKWAMTFSPNTAQLLKYVNGNRFTAHKDDKRHHCWVAIVCLVGSAYICFSKTSTGTVLHKVRVGQGDIYALTGPALRHYYHAVRPDPHFTGERVVLTLRATNLNLASEHERPLPRNPPRPYSNACTPPPYSEVCTWPSTNPE